MDGERRTARTGRRVNPGQESLGRGDGSIETLDDLAEGFADNCLLLQLGLEGAEDFGIEEGHCGG